MVRFSLPVYVTWGLAAFMVLLAFALNRQPRFLLLALPMLLALVAVPAALNYMNRRQAEKVDPGDYKLYRISELGRLESGEPVKVRGRVEAVSMKWLNRPHIWVNDGSGRAGIFMIWAPRQDIRPGDKVEAVGTVRSFGRGAKKIVGIKMRKI